MNSQSTIKQILRKKYFEIKKDLLLKNKNLTGCYHWALRQNLEKLVQNLLNTNKKNLSNNTLPIKTYLHVPERQIIPPCLSLSFQQTHHIKAKYFTPYFTTQNREMNFIDYNPNQSKSSQFKLGPYGIEVPILKQNNHQIDPEKLNILLVPLICIEQNSLNRIGYGGGYYDEYIKENRQKNTISVGVALEDLVFDQNNMSKKQNEELWNSWDQPLNYAITQKRILERKKYV